MLEVELYNQHTGNSRTKKKNLIMVLQNVFNWIHRHKFVINVLKKKNCIGQHESNVEQSTKAGKKITGNKHKKKFGI